VTTGKKFQYAGHGPGERVDRLRKEIELIDLEVHSHREMVAKLRYVQEFVMLTGEQAREVASEVGWRKEELRRLSKKPEQGARRERNHPAVHRRPEVGLAAGYALHAAELHLYEARFMVLSMLHAMGVR
jgi:hypothetical protein